MPRRMKIDTRMAGIHHRLKSMFSLKPSSSRTLSASPSSGWVAAVMAIDSSAIQARD